jgi:hypothetical protein
MVMHLPLSNCSRVSDEVKVPIVIVKRFRPTSFSHHLIKSTPFSRILRPNFKHERALSNIFTTTRE